jgi:hypothetical protein
MPRIVRINAVESMEVKSSILTPEFAASICSDPTHNMWFIRQPDLAARHNCDFVSLFLVSHCYMRSQSRDPISDAMAHLERVEISICNVRNVRDRLD